MSNDEWESHKRQIEREARMNRKFSLADVIGHEGAGFFRGESMVPKLTQATNALTSFVDAHLNDTSGAIKVVMKRRIRTNEPLVDRHLEDPLMALEALLDELLANDEALYEFVREVDVEWGRLMMERPHFQKPGEDAHPDDEHTHASVRADLAELRAKLAV